MTQRKIQSEQIELGDVIEGVGSSTDNAIVRFDGTTGGAVQGSPVTISDAGVIGFGGHTATINPTTDPNQFRFGFASNAGPTFELYKNTHGSRAGELAMIYGAGGVKHSYYNGSTWTVMSSLSSAGILDTAGGFTVGGIAVPTISSTSTLTNKRVHPIDAAVSNTGGMVIPNIDSQNMLYWTALAGSLTLAAPVGTPANGERLLLRIKDNGTARSLSWNAAYRAIGVTLPTTTVASKTMYIGMIYNGSDGRWDVVAVSVEA